MSYDISLMVKVEGIDKFVEVAEGGNTTYNVRELIKQASGWVIKDTGNNGLAEDIGKLVEESIRQLSDRPELYRQYEAKNGWGTVECTLEFFIELLNACKDHPYAYVFVS